MIIALYTYITSSATAREETCHCWLHAPGGSGRRQGPGRSGGPGSVNQSNRPRGFRSSLPSHPCISHLHHSAVSTSPTVRLCPPTPSVSSNPPLLHSCQLSLFLSLARHSLMSGIHQSGSIDNSPRGWQASFEERRGSMARRLGNHQLAGPAQEQARGGHHKQGGRRPGPSRGGGGGAAAGGGSSLGRQIRKIRFSKQGCCVRTTCVRAVLFALKGACFEV